MRIKKLLELYSLGSVSRVGQIPEIAKEMIQSAFNSEDPELALDNFVANSVTERSKNPIQASLEEMWRIQGFAQGVIAMRILQEDKKS